jgi:hypothetical protein
VLEFCNYITNLELGICFFGVSKEMVVLDLWYWVFDDGACWDELWSLGDSLLFV